MPRTAKCPGHQQVGLLERRGADDGRVAAAHRVRLRSCNVAREEERQRDGNHDRTAHGRGVSFRWLVMLRRLLCCAALRCASGSCGAGWETSMLGAWFTIDWILTLV